MAARYLNLRGDRDEAEWDVPVMAAGNAGIGQRRVGTAAFKGSDSLILQRV
jgi:hypothetical protein